MNLEKVPASKLEFIGRIKPDGSGIETLDQEHLDFLYTNPLVGPFRLSCLSISNKTYIASAMNSYIVKLKPVDKIQELKEEQSQLVKRLEEIKTLLK